MALKPCTCNGKPANTGRALCDLFPDIPYLPVLVRRTADDGTRNFIDTSVPLNAAYFNGKINQADASKRWYPLVPMKNVENTRAENIREEFNDGSSQFIREGVSSYTAMLLNVGPTYKGKLDEFRCADYDLFVIDLVGNINGIIEPGSDNLYGMPIDRGSWAPVWNGKTDQAVSKIMLQFNFEPSMNDSDIRIIPMATSASDGYTGIDLRNIQGLLDAHLVLDGAAPAPTTFTAAITTDYGYFVNPIKVKGLLAADFDLYNVTDSSNVTITSVTETPAGSGNYVFLYPSQTVGDVLRVTLTKDGYDATELSDGDHDLPEIV